MTATVVIPARFASTRFPGKMIAADTGRPLVQHVVDQAKKARRIRNVIVAADDHRIVEAVKPFGTIVTITSIHHQSGTDRIWEVVREWPGEVIVNVQGDEPEIEPQTIDRVVESLESTDVEMATAATQFPGDADVSDPNLVKVVMDASGRALYFSRSAIPFLRDAAAGDNAAYYLHLGIYAYKWDFLHEFTAWHQGQLEQTEKLEQLRALENGRAVHVVKVDGATHGIDTPQQYAAFVKRWKQGQ